MNSKSPRYLTVIVFLNFASIVLPVAMQYLAASSLLISFIINSYIRKRKPAQVSLYQADDTAISRLMRLLWFYFGVLFIVTVLSSLLSPYEIRTGKIFSEAWHISAKSSILPFALVGGLVYFRKSYEGLFDLSRALAIFFALYFIYCVIQRYTGINWVHGFSSQLPPNRFAYGVYRVSGFMGHPLSLAYNLVFAVLLFAHIAFSAFQNGLKYKAFWWGMSSVFCLGVLLISGSRWPLVVLAIAVAFLFSHKFLKNMKILVVIAAVFAGLLYFEGSLVRRTQEIFENGKISEKTVPRIAFWKTHWAMFEDNPLFGVGYSARKIGSVDYYNKTGYNNIERKYSAHNQFLQVLADTGLVGFLVFVGFLVWLGLLFRLITDVSTRKLLATFIVVAVTSGLMKNVFRDTEFLFGFWFCVAIGLAQLPLRSESGNDFGEEPTKTEDFKSTKNPADS